MSKRDVGLFMRSEAYYIKSDAGVFVRGCMLLADSCRNFIQTSLWRMILAYIPFVCSPLIIV
jgi:hypothetical protein